MDWIQGPMTGSLCMMFFFVYIWLAASLYALMAMQLCSELRIGIIKVEQVLNKLDTNISDVAIVWYFGLKTCIPVDVLKGLHISQG